MLRQKILSFKAAEEEARELTGGDGKSKHFEQGMRGKVLCKDLVLSFCHSESDTVGEKSCVRGYTVEEFMK